MNMNNQVLLGERMNCYKSGYWGMPGGRVELNESLDSAVRRELKEETGLISDEIKYLGVVRESQKSHDFVHFVYICSRYEGEVTLQEPDKCKGWMWFDICKLPDKVMVGHEKALELYNNKSIGLVDIVS